MWTRTILVVVMLIGVLTLPHTLLGQTQASWVGTWKLNLAKSKYSPGPPPKSSTVKVEPWENGLKTTTDVVTAQGEARHIEVSGKFDARDNPITGNPNALRLEFELRRLYSSTSLPSFGRGFGDAYSTG